MKCATSPLWSVGWGEGERLKENAPTMLHVYLIKASAPAGYPRIIFRSHPPAGWR